MFVKIYGIGMRKHIIGLISALLMLACMVQAAFCAMANSADAFMSLPFGHTQARTEKRMKNSGAQTVSIRVETLSMEGYFEGRPAVFAFGFDRKKGLKSKAVYIQSMGSYEDDRYLYNALRSAYISRFGNVRESPQPSAWQEGRVTMRSEWTPDKYTSIVLTYNPDATRRFPGASMGQRPIHLSYSYSKWD